jgi:carboxylesterase
VIRRVLRWVGIAVAAAIAVLLALALWPTSTSGLGSDPEPVGSYGAAVTAFDEVRAEDRRESTIPVCHSRLLTHGRKTERAMVLVHGLTNCPAQFLELGQEMYRQGWNVLILRLPHHGIGNPGAGTIGAIGNLGGLTARELARYGDRAVDIAQGLGDEVQVMGLSAGGVVAAWAAQERDDVERAIVIAPAIAIKGVPYALTWALTNFFDRVPDIALNDPGAVSHTYSGWSTRGLSETFTLGKRVKKNASVAGPDAPSVVFVLNPNDDDISNDVARDVADDWKRDGGNVLVFELPPRPVLEHDIIDPAQPWARPGFVYPRLIRLADAPIP